MHTSKRFGFGIALFLAFGLGGLSNLAAQTADQIHQQARAAIAAGRVSTALPQLRSAARRFPGNTVIQLDLGLALVRSGHLKEAIPALQKAAQSSALASEAHFLLAADYFEQADYAKAIEECRGLENTNNTERVLYMLEESSRRIGRLDDAKSAFHQLITRYPDSGWTHYLLGNAYENQQQLDKAIEEYKLALAADPTIPSAQFAIGYLYWRQQDFEDAREWLGKEAAAGCHALANFYLGEMARGEKQLTNAEKLYRRALECDPSNEQAHLRLGVVLGDQHRYEEAITQLKEAARLRPDESSAHYHLASIYSHMGRTAEAKAEYSKVRQIQAAKDNGVDVSREN